MALELRTLQPPEPLQHLDYTHPFAHRPLVEFLMTVPADVLCRPGEPRRLMRSALSDLWPRKLRERRDLSSRELGQLADVDHTYIYRLETGEKQSPSEDVLARLLKVLKAQPREVEMAQYMTTNEVNPDWV